MHILRRLYKVGHVFPHLRPISERQMADSFGRVAGCVIAPVVPPNVCQRAVARATSRDVRTQRAAM
jgi:hypothetical protein